VFTEVVIFGDVLGDMPIIDDTPRVDEDVAEMTFELFEMELPYQQSNKYKWLHYCIQDMVRCCEYCRRVIVYVVIQTEKKWNLWKMNATCWNKPTMSLP